MSSSITLKEVQSFLDSSSKTLNNPVAVFAGGTSGIGENTAYEFAKVSINPKIYIVGRNQEAADRVINRINEINSNAKCEFVKSDLILLKNSNKAADYILQKEPKINLVYVSCGYLHASGYTASDEGIDTKLSLHYLSRFQIIDKLLPSLDKAGNKGELARVVSVLAAGYETPLDFSNLDLKKYSSIKINSAYTPTLNSLSMEYLASKHPKVGFVHNAPGFVNTNILSALPFVLRWLAKPLLYFGTSAEECGKYQAYFSLNDKYKTGAHLIDSKLRDLTLPESITKDNSSSKVWQFTQEVFNQVRKNGKYQGYTTDIFSS